MRPAGEVLLPLLRCDDGLMDAGQALVVAGDVAGAEALVEDPAHSARRPQPVGGDAISGGWAGWPIIEELDQAVDRVPVQVSGVQLCKDGP
jgi:hypothetical protein